MEDLGKSIPAGEAFVDAETGGPAKRHNENCLNCGTRLIDAFCHHCGQKDIPKRQTLSELWTNFIASFWSYEGKFFQTTKYLIIRPGFLATQYNAGKRETYFHPARMYVFISFVFFLLYFSLPDTDDEPESPSKIKEKKSLTDSVQTKEKQPIPTVIDADEDTDDDDETFDEAKLDSILDRNLIGNDSAKKYPSSGFKDSLQNQIKKNSSKKNDWTWSLENADYKTVASYDSAQNAKPEADRDGWFKRIIKIRAIELNDRYKDDNQSFSKDFGNAFKDNFSKVLFWLLPFFALVLKLLYVRRGFYYSEHLVFTIYYYNFFYLAGSFQMMLGQLSWLSWFPTLIGYWIFFYLLFAMKRMYGQSWGKTILKFSIFVFLFSILAMVGLGISALVVIMMI